MLYRKNKNATTTTAAEDDDAVETGDSSSQQLQVDEQFSQPSTECLLTAASQAGAASTGAPFWRYLH